jgi:RND family efflux transporter MFP subunit
MKTFGTLLLQLTRWTTRIVVLLGFTAGVIVLMFWLAGKFTPKVPGSTSATRPQAQNMTGGMVKVRFIRLPLYETATGTIRSVHETTIASKLLARVVGVNLKAGQSVHAGDVLVQLDDTDLRAKLQQAKAAMASADARHSQAVSDEKRSAQLRKTNVVSQQEYEQNVTSVTSSAAELLRAQESIKEMQAMLDWATVRSPIDGIVTDKKIDVGDMVTPGQVLLTLFDPKQMQLIASVRESLTHQLKIGQKIGVQVDVLKKICSGTISEIVPEAQSASRTFQVKVTGPCPAGIYTGMFGRIMIPLQEEQVLVIPRQALQNVGQLELVDVMDNGRITRRAVRTGRPIEDDVEVLSGLSEGEEVFAPVDLPKRTVPFSLRENRDSPQEASHD